MADFKKYKWPIITIVVIVGVLMVMLTIGFTLGILSEDPDGLEKSVIDAKGGGEEGEAWIEELPSPWEPILGGIENDYIAGIIGLTLSVALMMVVFYGIIKLKQKNK